MQTLPRAGDRVIVPWGLHEAEGEVMYTSTRGTVLYVTVEVRIEYTDEPLVAIYPAEMIRSAASR